MSLIAVPFNDLAADHREIEAELDTAMARVRRSGHFVLGPEVEAFEAEWASYCGARYCVGVSNGLDALTLALRAHGIGPGDEVLVPSNTYIATWLAVSAVGAEPVPIEPDPRTYNICPGAIVSRIHPKTKAILAVHLYGQPADLVALRHIAATHGLVLLVDAAQAHGATYRGTRSGGLGDTTAYSFYPTKNLGALGDAGAVVTNDCAIADRLRLLRNYGSRVRYQNEVRGVNARLDELQAALLRTKLHHLDRWNQRRRLLARRYLEHLRGVRALELPRVIPDVEPVWHLFVVRCRDRARIVDALTAAGIGWLIHYPVPPHLAGAYTDLDLAHGSLPIAETLASEVVSLPMFPALTEAQQDRVIDALSANALDAL